jgi:hypothetical protein
LIRKDKRIRNRANSAEICRTRVVKALGMTGISKSQVSRLCEEIDERKRAAITPCGVTGRRV